MLIQGISPCSHQRIQLLGSGGNYGKVFASTYIKLLHRYTFDQDSVIDFQHLTGDQAYYAYISNEVSSGIDTIGGSTFGYTCHNGAYVENGGVVFWNPGKSKFDHPDEVRPGNYVAFNHSALLFDNFQSVSIEVWLTTGVNDNWARIFQFGPAANLGDNQNSVFLFRDARYSYICVAYVNANLDYNGDSTWETCSTTQFSNIHYPTHIVVTLTNNGYQELYVNGTGPFTSAFQAPLPAPNVFWMGRSFAGDSALVGTLSELRIWGGVLSQADVTTNFAFGPGERV